MGNEIIDFCVKESGNLGIINPEVTVDETKRLYSRGLSPEDAILALSSFTEFHNPEGQNAKLLEKLLEQLSFRKIGGLIFLIKHPSTATLPLFYPQISPKEATQIITTVEYLSAMDQQDCRDRAEILLGRPQQPNYVQGIVAIGGHPEANGCLQLARVKLPTL